MSIKPLKFREEFPARAGLNRVPDEFRRPLEPSSPRERG